MHNEHGSMSSMPHLQAMNWNFAERLNHITKGTTEAYYNYDGSGERVRKVVEKNGVTETRLYLGGFEIFRKKIGGNLELERETLHVMDDVKRIALVETLTVDNGIAVNNFIPVIRYQMSNNIESAALELDDNASIISYEEYYPYGDTSYQSGRSASEVSQKRYRYTSKEKDNESGLYYHSTRYYASWLGRWTAADPAGLVDGVNLYMYCRGNPIALLDNDGKQPFYPISNDNLENSINKWGWQFSDINVDTKAKSDSSNVSTIAQEKADDTRSTVARELGSSYITREEWGALNLNHKWKRDKVEKNCIVIHHTSSKRTAGSIDKFHNTKKRDYGGIGYHFFIDLEGKVHEGRPLEMLGSHVGGKNSGRIGVSLAGNFEGRMPNDAQLESMQKLVEILQDVYSIPNSGVTGHKDHNNKTKCPGKQLYNYIRNHYHNK